MKESLLDQLLEETRQTNKQTDKLTQIDDAAIALFSEKGFANTSTKEIAAKANVAEGTIFKHYKTKDNLLLNILLKFIKVLIPVMKKDIAKKLSAQAFESVDDFIRYFIKNRIAFVIANQEILRIFVKELIYNDSLRQNLMTGHFDDIVQLFYDYFDQFKAKGQLRDVPNEVLINKMLKIILADVVWVFVITDRYKTTDFDAWTETMIDQFLEGLRPEGAVK
jgi:AcrR family transcriptional regulator